MDEKQPKAVNANKWKGRVRVERILTRTLDDMTCHNAHPFPKPIAKWFLLISVPKPRDSLFIYSNSRHPKHETCRILIFCFYRLRIYSTHTFHSDFVINLVRIFSKDCSRSLPKMEKVTVCPPYHNTYRCSFFQGFEGASWNSRIEAGAV